jgi:hypothetical protein
VVAAALCCPPLADVEEETVTPTTTPRTTRTAGVQTTIGYWSNTTSGASRRKLCTAAPTEAMEGREDDRRGGTAFTSPRHLLQFFTASNPIGAQLAARLSDEQRAEASRVLDGMLRERSAGAPGAVLRNEVNIGIGTV